MTTLRPDLWSRTATPLARSPAPRIRMVAGISLFRTLVQYPPERVKCEIHENEESGVQRYESCGPQTWVRQPVKEIGRRTGRVLQDVAAVKPDEPADIDASAGEGGEDQDKYPTRRSTKLPSDDLLHQVKRHHA